MLALLKVVLALVVPTIAWYFPLSAWMRVKLKEICVFALKGKVYKKACGIRKKNWLLGTVQNLWGTRAGTIDRGDVFFRKKLGGRRLF